MVDFHAHFSHANKSWAPASIALWNGGGIRASVAAGKVTVSLTQSGC